MTSKKPKCSGCNQVITGPVLMAMNKAWHKEHFICTHCKKQLGQSKFLQEDGQPYCEDDWNRLFKFKDAPICADCDKPITDYVVNAMGKTWHKPHFVCTKCKKSFTNNKFFEYESKPYCEDDYKKIAPQQNCAGCNKPITDTPVLAVGKQWHKDHFVCNHCKKPVPEDKFMAKDGNPYCEADFKKLFGSADKGNAMICAQCNQPITDTIVAALGKTWHKDHFTCAHCKKPIMTSVFNIQDGKPYCEADYQSLFGKKCYGCGNMIKEAVLMALDKNWHKACFTCKKCKKTIPPALGFMESNGNPICVGCNVN